MNQPRRLLPLVGAAGHSGRSAMTCLYRCGNACDHPVPTESDNAYFGDLAAGQLSRRGVVRAGAAGALVLGFGGGLSASAPAAAQPGAAQPAADPAGVTTAGAGSGA